MTDDFDPVEQTVAARLCRVPVADDPRVLAAALTAYRRSRSGRRTGRRAAVCGGRVATVSLVTAISGFLAAGYAAALPDPVQRAAHHLLAPAGLPAPHHHHHRSPSLPSTPSPQTHAKPARPLAEHAPAATSRSLPALRLELSLPSTLLPAGTRAVARVAVAPAQGPPVVAVAVQVAPRRSGPWHTVMRATVHRPRPTSLSLPALQDNTWVRVVAARTVSAPTRVRFIPVLLPTWHHRSDGSWELVVAGRGLHPGDQLLLTESSAGGAAVRQWAHVGRDHLARFVFSVGPGPSARMTLRVYASARHAAAVIAVAPPRSPTAS